MFCDIVKTLNVIVEDTYLGGSVHNEVNIAYSDEDKSKHFDWCWTKTIDSFSKENINFELNGDHKDYFSNL